MQKCKEPSFFGANTIDAAHSDVAGSITFSSNIRFISSNSNYRCRGPARHGCWNTGLASSLILCFVTSIVPICPSHISSYGSSTSNNFLRYCSYYSSIITCSLQSFFKSILSLFNTCSCFDKMTCDFDVSVSL